MRSTILTWVLVIATWACGGSSPPKSRVPTPQERTASAASEETNIDRPAASQPFEFPSSCSETGKLCTPPPAFVEEFCSGHYPSAGLALFAKGTPWTRRFIRGKLNAWNASGGATESVELAYGEEVLVLRHRPAATGGMMVSGASDSYDVMRWDGACVTVDGGEIAEKGPSPAAYAEIQWKRLSEATQDALLMDDAVAKANKARRDECKGVTMGEVSDKCVRAVQDLSRSIVAYVRKGGVLPVLSKLE